MTMANSSSPTEKTNGVVQLPVRSRIQPNAIGERIPVAFIKDLKRCILRSRLTVSDQEPEVRIHLPPAES